MSSNIQPSHTFQSSPSATSTQHSPSTNKANSSAGADKFTTGLEQGHPTDSPLTFGKAKTWPSTKTSLLTSAAMTRAGSAPLSGAEGSASPPSSSAPGKPAATVDDMKSLSKSFVEADGEKRADEAEKTFDKQWEEADQNDREADGATGLVRSRIG